MKKLTIIISLILVSTFLSGCGKQDGTKVEPRKNIMGHGNEKVDGSPTKHGGI